MVKLTITPPDENILSRMTFVANGVNAVKMTNGTEETDELCFFNGIYKGFPSMNQQVELGINFVIFFLDERKSNK